MHVLVVYDIEDDGLRTKISDTLKDWGFERIQYSVFIGLATATERNLLETRLDELLQYRKEKDSIITVSMCKGCVDNVVTLGVDRQLNQLGTKVLFL